MSRVATPARDRTATTTWRFRLYVAGTSPRSLFALANLRSLCEQHLPGGYLIDIVDLAEEPALARRDDILAIPTVVRTQPEPVRRVIGDLSQADRAVVGLGLLTSPAVT